MPPPVLPALAGDEAASLAGGGGGDAAGALAAGGGVFGGWEVPVELGVAAAGLLEPLALLPSGFCSVPAFFWSVICRHRATREIGGYRGNSIHHRP